MVAKKDESERVKRVVSFVKTDSYKALEQEANTHGRTVNKHASTILNERYQGVAESTPDIFSTIRELQGQIELLKEAQLQPHRSTRKPRDNVSDTNIQASDNPAALSDNEVIKTRGWVKPSDQVIEYIRTCSSADLERKTEANGKRISAGTIRSWQKKIKETGTFSTTQEIYDTLFDNLNNQ